MNQLNLPLSPGSTLTRQTLLSVLKTALAVGEKRYARRIALAWLSNFPGDLQVAFLHAQACFQEDTPSSRQLAIAILEKLCEADPEYLESQKLLTQAYQHENQALAVLPESCVLALGGSARISKIGKQGIPSWALQVREARKALSTRSKKSIEDSPKIEDLIHQALLDNPETPLVACTHLQIVMAQHSLPKIAIRSLAQAYQERWPECLQFKLILADCLMETSEPDQAVALLHQAVVRDIIGQVPLRLWGDQHPYRNLWPEFLEISPLNASSPQNIPVPARVAAGMGWNQLPETTSIDNLCLSDLKYQATEDTPNKVFSPFNIGEKITSKKYRDLEADSQLDNSSGVQKSEALQSIQAELDALAARLKQPHLARLDGRFPVYLVFTTRRGLALQYGEQNVECIDEEMKRLVSTVRTNRTNQEHWGAILFYADDHRYTSPFGMKPAAYNDPWGLKLLISDLDDKLGERGEMIGALLIVGGPQVVPFHHLPNPVDDGDADVPSDNPYATRDENYFIPEWPVGRLPGDRTSNPEILLNTLKAITQRYARNSRPRHWYQEFWQRLRERIQSRSKKNQVSMGYTAAIWRRASHAVYRAIGEPRSLLVSPPIEACEITSDENYSHSSGEQPHPGTCLVLPNAKLGYFNLHGLADTVEWYGQRDPTDPNGGPDFPIALRPQDLASQGSSPQVVFSEACFGAMITGKCANETLALKFLDTGSQAFIGSTCISYGSIASPLIAADLLGRTFWNFLREGMFVGEALRRAKIHLAREMHRRQGYLDGEDQKTLISFILYGDPLANPVGSRHKSKTIQRSTLHQPAMETTRSITPDEEIIPPIPSETIAHVKDVVAKYLPGMQDAQLRYSLERVEGQPGGFPLDPVSSTPEKKHHKPFAPSHQVITLSKSIKQAKLIHQQYAHLKLNSDGKLIKIAVSR